MHVLRRVGIATGLVASAALSIALALPAHADTAAQAGDAVGVGSDTAQNAADFAFDGSPGQSGGYNSVGNLNRAVNVFATGDANGRALYDGTCGTPDASGLGVFCNGTTNQAPNQLSGSVILRAGTKPVLRPNGSGQGVAALIADSSAGYDGLPARSIQFARMSRLPNSTEISNCNQAGSSCGALHVFQAATDNLAMAHVTSGYDGPAALSAQELINIYSCTTTKWNALPGNSGGSGNTIHPLIPQSGSGTRTFFLADLQAVNGGNPITLGSCVRQVQEHDPTGIYADNASADAIEPFSTGKLALINTGYYTNGVTSPLGTTNAAYAPNYLTVDTSGNAGDNNPVYDTSRGIFFVVRQSDYISTTPFQPGSAQNFVQALFSSGASAIRSGSGRGELAQAGFTTTNSSGASNFKDCGLNPTTC